MSATAPKVCAHRVPQGSYCKKCDPAGELVVLSQAQKALATVETVEDAKSLYNQLEALGQYARRYRLEHDQQNEIAEAKLRTARKGGELLRAFVARGYKSETRIPDGISRSQSSRWQSLAAIAEADFEDHLEAVKASDNELTLAGALRFQKSGVHFSSDTDQWSTPQDLFDLLDAEFAFTLDVCADSENAKCADYFSEADNGLAKRWSGSCWMNPPYGSKIGLWVEKAAEEASRVVDGCSVVCLLPARTDTTWWWEFCIKGQVRFLRGRLKFGGGANSAPFPSAVVVFPAKPEVIWWERAA